MFLFLYLLKRHRRIFKAILAFSFLTITYLIIFLVHLFKQQEIHIKKLKFKEIDNINFIQIDIKFQNRSIFNVYLDDVKLELDRYDIGLAQIDNKRLKKMIIPKRSKMFVEILFRIKETFENDELRGNFLIVMSKFKIKIPFERKINISDE